MAAMIAIAGVRKAHCSTATSATATCASRLGCEQHLAGHPAPASSWLVVKQRVHARTAATTNSSLHSTSSSHEHSTQHTLRGNSLLPWLAWLVGVAARAAHSWLQTTTARVEAAAAAAGSLLSSSSPSAAAAQQQATDMLRQMRMLALVVPFAQVTSGGGFQANVWMPFWQALFGFTHFYLFILFMRVLLSWFPALDWSRNPWLVIKVITDPYLNVFRNLIPALFMAIDLTPLLGFMLLQDFVAILENCVVENLFSDTIDEPTSDPFIYMPQDYSRFTPTKPA